MHSRDQKYLNILLVLISLIVIFFATRNFLGIAKQESKSVIPKEFTEVIFYEATTLDSITSQKLNQILSTHQVGYFEFIFLIESNNCSNCLNEVVDYIDIFNRENLEVDYRLIYYGQDLISSQRYVKASGILEYFDQVHFLSKDSVDLVLETKFFRGLGGNFLFHFTPNNQSLSHLIVLPTGVTTTVAAKKIALDAFNVN